MARKQGQKRKPQYRVKSSEQRLSDLVEGEVVGVRKEDEHDTLLHEVYFGSDKEPVAYSTSIETAETIVNFLNGLPRTMAAQVVDAFSGPIITIAQEEYDNIKKGADLAWDMVVVEQRVKESERQQARSYSYEDGVRVYR